MANKDSKKNSETSDLEVNVLSDAERTIRVASSLKKWQRGAYVCLFLCVVVMGTTIVMFLGGGSSVSDELVPLELLPEIRLANLSEKIKKERRATRKLSKDLKAMLASDEALAVVTDSQLLVQTMIDSEKQFLNSIIEYGKAMEVVTLSIGGAKEWNYGFQKSLSVYEKSSQSRISGLELIIEKFPSIIDQ